MYFVFVSDEPGRIGCVATICALAFGIIVIVIAVFDNKQDKQL